MSDHPLPVRWCPSAGQAMLGAMRIRAAAAVAAVVLLTACSGGGDGAGDASPQPPSPTEAVSASAEQWASKIAPLRADIEKQQATWDEATCSSLAAAGGAADCQAWMVAMGLQSQTVAITVGGLASPDQATYLGDPPAEIADLVSQTLAAAEAAVAADEAVACPGDDCASTAFEFERAWDALRSVMASWEPYL